MALSTALTATFGGFLITLQFTSLAIAYWRMRRGVRRDETQETSEFIALVRPLCGLNAFEEETLRSSFHQDYPGYEIVFCVASRFDPVIPLVEKLMAEYPHQRARLLTGDDKISANPKVNNLNKAWENTTAGIVAMADSNLLLPPNYLRSLVNTFDAKTGMVSSPAIGIRPENIWGAVEAAMLNTHQARWQYLSDFLGNGFAQGKTLCWRREVLDNGGGMAALGSELAEDVASTKLVRRAGLKVRLPAQPFAQPVGHRRLDAVWSRQLRWARIRRDGFFWLFVPEIIMGFLPALAAVTWLTAAGDLPLFAPAALFVLWFGGEWALAKALGWPHQLRDILAMCLRDIMMPALWLGCWAGRGFTWRGNPSGEKSLSGKIKLTGKIKLSGKKQPVPVSQSPGK
ncbi:ceramide glucosyltransferase [Rahnella sp. PD12R]|uniref:ceramide glucosyltransferase n=1 Tax=Rahnella sp. PD12R TaxID=2855688 RepID=UPI001C46FC6A|nr:ceramide glucosyltransferase [Rahnella sp. PD12R]MBV6819205.1 ceramide glucosyltransferase [Rahnella sp. PD12R]